MVTNEIAVICDGKEIAYGLNIKHLFQFDINGERYHSKLGCNKTVEIYTPAVFKRENGSKNTTKIIIGAFDQVKAEYTPMLDCFGMGVFTWGNTCVVCADSSKMTSAEYEKFIIYANMKRREYINIEQEYFDLVSTHDCQWIAGEFVRTHQVGMFSKRNKLRIIKQQQYDCLSYVLYLDYLKGL